MAQAVTTLSGAISAIRITLALALAPMKPPKACALIFIFREKMLLQLLHLGITRLILMATILTLEPAGYVVPVV
tara:strand:+ start:277 stop:498 length:222 start_codon:yes stop_codon:yes gene_type:complete